MSIPVLYEELRRLVRTAQFDDNLITRHPQTGARTVRVVSRQLEFELRRLGFPKSFDPERSDLVVIKSLVQMSECSDYYGDFASAARLSEPGNGVLQEGVLAQSRATDHDDRKRRQSLIRLAVSYARSLYRHSEFDEAESILLECRRYVESYLMADNYRNLGTLGEIAYTLGRLYRQLRKFDIARREFHKAIRFYEERANRSQAPGTPGDDLQFSIHKLATIAALGLAQCNYTTGALSTALYGNLASARLLLGRTGDILNSKYADVIHASAVRALEGRDGTDLTALSATVNGAAKVFHQYGHTFYEAGAMLELAYLELAKRNFDAALAHCDAVMDLAVKSDYRWRFGVLIVRSRALRHKNQLSKAMIFGNDAHHRAEVRKDTAGQIDALIVRSDAYPRDSIRKAIEDLDTAIRLNRSESGPLEPLNPRIQAECYLRKAAHYFELGELQDASANFEEWERLNSVVENARLHRMARETAEKIKRGRKLLIDLDKDGQSYNELDVVIRKFLLVQAAKRSPKVAAIARDLNLGRGTIYGWLEEFQLDPEIKALAIKDRNGDTRQKR